MRRATSVPRRQRGITLIVTLVVLLLVGLVAVTSMGGSERNLRVAGNMQMRNEAMAAAQSLVEQTLSSAAFTRDPAAAAAVPYPTDVDGDGNPDYVARLDPRPACLRVRPVKTAEQVQQRRLSCARRATHDDELAGVHLHVDVDTGMHISG